MLVALCEQFTLFYKGSACKSSANLDDIAVSKTPVYTRSVHTRDTLYHVSLSCETTCGDTRTGPHGRHKASKKHPPQRKGMDLHRAAAAGDVEQVVRCLRADPKPEPNAPDEAGRTAMFYAQVRQHHHIVNVLEGAGWMRMPEGNVFAGPGGRAMWWNSGVWATARPQCHRVALPKAVVVQPFYAQRTERTLAKEAPKVEPARKERIRSRHLRRSFDYRCESNTVGPGHRWYLRKEHAYKKELRARMRPCLNTDDTPEAYSKPSASLLVASLRTLVDLDECSDDDDDATTREASLFDAAHELPVAPTIGGVARFIVARCPTRAPDGTWVVVEASGAEEAALMCTPIGTAATPSLAPIAENENETDDETDIAQGREERAPADETEVNASEWPALPALPMPLREEWVLLRTVSEDDVASLTDATSSFAEVDGSKAASLIDDDGCGSRTAADHSTEHSTGPGFEVDDEAICLTAAQEIDAPLPTPNPHTPPSASALAVANLNSRGAWGDGVETRAIVGFADGAPAVFTRPQQIDPKPSPARVILSPGCELAGSEAAVSKVAAAMQMGSAEEPIVGEGAELLVCDTAGLKDACHRTRGSQRTSVSAMCKREASKVKRVAARSRY